MTQRRFGDAIVNPTEATRREACGLVILGGTVHARLKRSEFGDAGGFTWHADGEFGEGSADGGVDADWGIWLPLNLQLNGTLSYVRGRRRDIDGDLCRIAALRGRATLTWTHDRWSASLEGVYAARQDHVSSTNSDIPAGWRL